MKRLFFLLLSALLLAMPCRPAGANGTLRFDFETGDLQGWRVAEGHFAKVVSDRAFFHNAPTVRYNKEGKFFLTTLERGDDAPDDSQTGVIESPVFRLQGSSLSFLVGGGAHPDTYVALCTEEGEIVRQACGNDGETMRRVEWNTASLAGKRLFLQIVDRNTGSWGHITFDDFQGEGEIDSAATEKVRATFAAREKVRLAQERRQEAARAAARARHARELRSDAYLFARGKQRVYQGENLGAILMPVGGIGAGSISMNGRCERPVWQIFNNFSQAAMPDSFFAVRAAPRGEQPRLRALQTTSVGPFAAMQSLRFRGEYPFGWYEFTDRDLSVQVSLEVFNPMMPLDARRSGIPCAIYNLTAKNPGRKPVEVSFLAAQQNVVGYTGADAIRGRSWPGYGGNSNQVRRENGATLLHLTANGDKEATGYGDMVLGMRDAKATASASWSDTAALAADFADGALNGPEDAGPSPRGETLDGALASSFTLKPGESRTVTCFLAWHFPNGKHGEGAWGGPGNQYANWWPDALAVARMLCADLDTLTRQTRLYHDTFYASNLPVWLLDRISGQTAILRSQTCFWTRDGYFGGWEGCGSRGGSCVGNCSHVWHYAQAPARLFPQIGRLLRDEELAHQTPEGAIPHRQLPGFNPAFDGQCGTILGAYREHLLSRDSEWLRAAWPRVKKAMDYTIATWDRDEDGVLAGPQWNTLDANLSGSTSWMGSLYLASLAASERMAALNGDAASAERYAAIRRRGAPAQDQALFNGEYYIQRPDAAPQRDYRDGCHIDQVLGQWWANQLDLGQLYPRAHVQSALRALLKYNFHTDFSKLKQAPRKFVADEDAGMQMITWPRGERPEPKQCMIYADEVMSGFEYSAAAAMIQSGLLKEGFTVARAAADRYDGRLRTGLSGGDWASWGYSGNPFGDDECGKYYARAMSAWSLLLAAQGFLCDGPAGRIGFLPVWRPEDHASFFTAAEGWGLFSQRRRGKEQRERLELRGGALALRELVFSLPEGRRAAQSTVTVGGKAVPVRAEMKDERVTLSLATPVTLQAGDALEAVIRCE